MRSAVETVLRTIKFKGKPFAIKADYGSPVKLNIGDYGVCQKKFGAEEQTKFGETIKDFNPPHKDETKRMIFEKGFLYGHLGNSLFSGIIGSAFPNSQYLSQMTKFRRPVFLDEEILARVEVTGIDKRKKCVTFKTTVRKVQTHEITHNGYALVKIPNLNTDPGI